MKSAISISAVNKQFGSKRAVQDLNLEIPEGALYGVIGPNGAGKSTTLRMILSILFPDSGSIRVLGHDSALKAKDQIGYLPEERGVYKKMQVLEFLQHMGILKGLGRADAKAKALKWLDTVGLPDVQKKRCEELSKGMQQKIQFISAVIHDPELLILDEPFSGLDPVNMRLLRELVEAQHRKGTTILFSTHVMPQAEEMCDHIVMLHQGRKVLDNSLDEIKRQEVVREILFEPLHAESVVPAQLAAVPGIDGVEGKDRSYRLKLVEGADLEQTVQALTRSVVPARLELVRPRLEDLFVSIVTGSGQTEESV
ncbi:hypothetical protein C7S18_03430 [Ahniella affigens]|uniref:ABC transporter domain-containing protein n=1 Tax=Ahniella affigens TaxID=2021234 RepID=A0A2P1PN92_9GAMM|nr:ATP-binding cassette domain-containing protein [Ahniella affigens]AVP96297.1 hypothetical protein C7S18_03430 [Ahniella affigens]